MSSVSSTPERVEVQARDLLVEVLRQHVDTDRVALTEGEQLDLGEHLVGERVAHHEDWVAGGVAEVHQAPLGEHEHAAARRQAPLVHLRLDLDLARRPASVSSPAMSISLSKWPTLATMARCFMPEDVVDA